MRQVEEPVGGALVEQGFDAAVVTVNSTRCVWVCNAQGFRLGHFAWEWPAWQSCAPTSQLVVMPDVPNTAGCIRPLHTLHSPHDQPSHILPEVMFTQEVTCWLPLVWYFCIFLSSFPSLFRALPPYQGMIAAMAGWHSLTAQITSLP